ncbi:MAG: GIY-YIG nuclease family protein [Patescibacteria group bacterium]
MRQNIRLLRHFTSPSLSVNIPRNDIHTRIIKYSVKKFYCVYIITNYNNTVLYTGVTGELIGRVWHHKNKSVSSFSSKYNLNKLVYFEIFENVSDAIVREKQIKGGSRKNKIKLIEKENPEWKDLYGSLLY